MTSKLTLPIVAFGFLLLVFSCGNKNKETTTVTPEPPSNEFLLSGKWKVLFSADDDNENGQLDEEEKVPPEDGEEMYISFLPEGMGTVLSKSKDQSGIVQEETDEFTWTLLNDQTRIQIIEEYTDSIGTRVVTQRDTSIIDILYLSENSTTWGNKYVYAFNGDTTIYWSWLQLEKVQ
ncbi:MAG: hypothetical protein H6550_14610 [Chitinophagales bacterium]|nr:hypothetical protein [Chitinophagales bacterium]